jgi:hypothetical protein
MATRRRICRIRVLAKVVIFENWPDSIHSPTFANLFWSDSIHSPDIRQPLSPDSIHSPDIRQPLSPDSIHSPKAIFEKNVTRLDTFAQVIRHFGEFGASGHCLIIIQYVYIRFGNKYYKFAFDFGSVAFILHILKYSV